MSRAVRRVPADWSHPVDERGHHVPLHAGPYEDRVREWDEGRAKWDEGLVADWRSGGWRPRDDELTDYEQWHGPRPVADGYMPTFAPGAATHYQMYEETSEGTPISPVHATPEDLATWLADNGANAGFGARCTRDEWLAMIGHGHSVGTMLIVGDEVVNGVAAVSR